VSDRGRKGGGKRKRVVVDLRGKKGLLYERKKGGRKLWMTPVPSGQDKKKESPFSRVSEARLGKKGSTTLGGEGGGLGEAFERRRKAFVFLRGEKKKDSLCFREKGRKGGKKFRRWE